MVQVRMKTTTREQSRGCFPLLGTYAIARCTNTYFGSV